jgi:hypothetical protein
VYSRTAKAGADFYVIVVMVAPIILSYYLYNTYQEKGPAVEFVVVQPNIDPYTEKFADTENFIPFEEQVRRFIELSEKQITPNTRFVLWPETAIDGSYWEESIENEAVINGIKAFVGRHPQMNLLTGVTSLQHYENKKQATPTARFRADLGYFDVYNTALFVRPNQPLLFYHKSKLVPGVEILPYPEVFGVLTDLVFSFGGTSGGYGRQEERTGVPPRFRPWHCAGHLLRVHLRRLHDQLHPQRRRLHHHHHQRRLVGQHAGAPAAPGHGLPAGRRNPPGHCPVGQYGHFGFHQPARRRVAGQPLLGTGRPAGPTAAKPGTYFLRSLRGLHRLGGRLAVAGRHPVRPGQRVAQAADAPRTGRGIVNS